MSAMSKERIMRWLPISVLKEQKHEVDESSMACTSDSFSHIKIIKSNISEVIEMHHRNPEEAVPIILQDANGLTSAQSPRTCRKGARNIHAYTSSEGIFII